MKNKYNQPYFRSISTKAERKKTPVQYHNDIDYRHYDKRQEFPITFDDDILVLSTELYQFCCDRGCKPTGKVILFVSKKS